MYPDVVGCDIDPLELEEERRDDRQHRLAERDLARQLFAERDLPNQLQTLVSRQGTPIIDLQPLRA